MLFPFLRSKWWMWNRNQTGLGGVEVRKLEEGGEVGKMWKKKTKKAKYQKIRIK